MNMPSIESRTLLKFGEAVGFRENGPEKAGNAQKKAVVLNPNVGFGKWGVNISTADTPGLLGRTDANTTQPRLRFLKAVLFEFGIPHKSDATVDELKALAKERLPESVRNVMKLEDYGTFFKHPLSDYRVTTVLRAVANEKAKMENMIRNVIAGNQSDEFRKFVRSHCTDKDSNFTAFSSEKNFSDFKSFVCDILKVCLRVTKCYSPDLRSHSFQSFLDLFMAEKLPSTSEAASDLLARIIDNIQDNLTKVHGNLTRVPFPAFEGEDIKNLCSALSEAVTCCMDPGLRIDPDLRMDPGLRIYPDKQPLDGGTKSLVLNDLKDQEKIFEYGSALEDAVVMTELKWGDNDMTAFQKWLGTRDAESACKESQATDIEGFITELVANFAASKKHNSESVQAKNDIPEQVVQKQVEKAKSEEEVQIENLAKPGSVPPNNEPLGDKKCGEENGDRQMLEYSIFDSKTNTTQKFFTYPQLGGTGNHCFFLSALRHLNITPSSENAQTLRKTMGEAFQQLKEALEPQLWDVREELGRQAQAWKIERLDLRKERKTASNERRLDIDDRLRKIDEELKSLKDQVIGISKQLGEVDRKPAGNPLAANCPVKYSGCRPQGCTFDIPREDDPDPYELVELFDAELNSDAKVFGLGSRKMADLAHAALLPQILKRPVIVVSVDLAGKLIDGVRDGGFAKFTKNALTGEDYKDKDPVYIRFQKHFNSPEDNGHFEAMVPVPDGKAQGQDQQNDLNRLLGVDRLKKGTGFLTQLHLKKEVKRAFDDKLPSDGWAKHLKLQELNQALRVKGAEADKLRLALEKKLDDVAAEIDNGNKPVKQLKDDLYTWLCGFRDRALALI